MLTERKEFGYSRSVCGCHGCKTNCMVMPGYLIPDDLTRMVPAGADPLQWADGNLLASPGAVARRDGVTFRIPTLVPAVNPDGSCKNLVHGRCAIHAVAPFGCAFFSCKDTQMDTDLSRRGIMTVYRAWVERAKGGSNLYTQVWMYLHSLGKTQRGPELLREKMMATL